MTTTTAAETTAPDALRDTAQTTPPRPTKHDRVALSAVRIAAALPGNWTVGRGRTRHDAADLLCLDTGFRIGLQPWERRAWGYHLVPDQVPSRLRDVFVWPWPHKLGKADFPGFSVRTPAAEVAAYIHDVFVPAYRQALARAEIDLRERAEAHARGQADRAKARARGQAVSDELATQLLDAITSTSCREESSRGEPVSVGYLPYNNVIRIELTLPVNDAIARAPALARALGAPLDDTAPHVTADCARPAEHRTPVAGNRHRGAGRSNQNDRNGKRRA